MFGCTISTRGPTRWNETSLAPPPVPRSSPMSFELGDLDEHRAGALVPVEREEAVDFLHAGGARLDRLNRAGAGLGAAATTAAAASGLLCVDRLGSMKRKHQDHEREYDGKCDGCF